jgi:cellulose synthase/poly-beta-1,6-N-acetylglucosamine synthase-like glycosyltransferase
MFATQFGNFFVHDFALTKSHMPKIDISVPVYGEPKFSEKIKMNAS